MILLLVTIAQQGLSIPDPRVTASPDVECTPDSDTEGRWVSFLPIGTQGGSAGSKIDVEAHPDIRRRQGSASITTPATTASTMDSYTTDAYEAPPSLAPARSDLLSSLSSLDSSLDAQVNSVISQMTTAQCVGVPDINGSAVTLCGPTVASAPPGSSSRTDNAAARGTAAAGGLLFGIVGAFLL